MRQNLNGAVKHISELQCDPAFLAPVNEIRNYDLAVLRITG